MEIFELKHGVQSVVRLSAAPLGARGVFPWVFF